MTPDNGNREKTYEVDTKIRAITCCRDKSDLCYKNEISPDRWGWIRYKSGSETGARDLGSGTTPDPKKSCDFCAEYPDTLYCEHTHNPMWCRDFNCGDHFCTAADCLSEYEQSSVYDPNRETGCRVNRSYGFTISAEDGSSQTCTAMYYCDGGKTYEPKSGS